MTQLGTLHSAKLPVPVPRRAPGPVPRPRAHVERGPRARRAAVRQSPLPPPGPRGRGPASSAPAAHRFSWASLAEWENVSRSRYVCRDGPCQGGSRTGASLWADWHCQGKCRATSVLVAGWRPSRGYNYMSFLALPRELQLLDEGIVNLRWLRRPQSKQSAPEHDSVSTISRVWKVIGGPQRA